MKVIWDYDEKDYSKDDPEFELLPPGEYQVRIIGVEFKTSKSGNDMFVIKLEPLDSGVTLRFYLTFDPQKPKMTNQFLGRIYDSFGMEDWSYTQKSDADNWIGCWGAAEVINEEFVNKSGDKQMSNKIKKFLIQERQIELGFVKPKEEVTIPF